MASIRPGFRRLVMPSITRLPSNLTAQGRAQNRRVDIVILSDHGATETVASDNKQNGKPSPALP